MLHTNRTTSRTVTRTQPPQTPKPTGPFETIKNMVYDTTLTIPGKKPLLGAADPVKFTLQDMLDMNYLFSPADGSDLVVANLSTLPYLPVIHDVKAIIDKRIKDTTHHLRILLSEEDRAQELEDAAKELAVPLKQFATLLTQLSEGSFPGARRYTAEGPERRIFDAITQRIPDVASQLASAIDQAERQFGHEAAAAAADRSAGVKGVGGPY